MYSYIQHLQILVELHVIFFFFFYLIITTFTNYKYSHIRYLQYIIATHIINNTTTVYTTYNTIQYLHHYY